MTFSRRPRLAQQNRGRIASGGGGSAFTPAALSPVLWLRADLGITLNGSTVSAWADQSGNANHFTQANPALQPNYVASDSDLLNQSAVRFDIASNVLACSNSITLGWVGAVAVYPAATFADFATILSKGAAAGDFIWRGDSGTANWRVGADVPAGSTYVRDGATTTVALTTANAPHVYEMAPGSPVAASTWIIGINAGFATRIWSDSVAEVVVCTTAPSAGLLAQWRSYCQGRYGSP